MDQNGPFQAKMDQNGPFWSCECLRKILEVRNKSHFDLKMVVGTILDHFGPALISDSAAYPSLDFKMALKLPDLPMAEGALLNRSRIASNTSWR